MQRVMQTVALTLGLCATWAGCTQPRGAPPGRQVSGGDVELGRVALERFGCGGCHLIPGVARARSQVAPPLTAYGERAYVAGVVSNSAENLILWIMDPQRVSPRTAMPNLDVPEQEARHMAAYLYSLRDD